MAQRLSNKHKKMKRNIKKNPELAWGGTHKVAVKRSRLAKLKKVFRMC
jgi:hypothetical protein